MDSTLVCSGASIIFFRSRAAQGGQPIRREILLRPAGGLLY